MTPLASSHKGLVFIFFRKILNNICNVKILSYLCVKIIKQALERLDLILDLAIHNNLNFNL